MFPFDKSSTASSLHITNEMQNPKGREKKLNLKSFTNKKVSAERAEKATDTRTPYYSFSCIVRLCMSLTMLTRNSKKTIRMIK